MRNEIHVKRERLGKENKINYSSRKWWDNWRDGELDIRSNKTFTFIFIHLQ